MSELKMRKNNDKQDKALKFNHHMMIKFLKLKNILTFIRGKLIF